MSTPASNIVALNEHEVQSMKSLFEQQSDAYRKLPMPGVEERKENLKSLRRVFLAHKDKLIDAVSADFSCRSKDETLLAEFLTTLGYIDHDLKHIKRWMKPKRRKVGIQFLPAKARVMYQPVGVVGIIAPWNYPIVLAIGPLISALAAGNRAMLKLSEFTPKTAEAIKAMLSEAFSQEQVVVITGGPEIAAEFTKLPFNHLFFTGSTNVGRLVMRAASENLTPVTLELGGKSPTIIAPDANIQNSAEIICFGKTFNSGQTCIAPDYILCPKDQQEAFIESFKASYEKMYPTIKENPDYTGIINERQLSRLKNYLTDAVAKGGEIVELNPTNDELSDTRKMALRLVKNGSDDMLALKEEIFGPILPIIPYDNLQDAIDYVNNRPRPLALYFFGSNKAEQKMVLNQTHSGDVCINDTLSHFAQGDLPFGGVGPSGMGFSHGIEGFKSFSHAKSILSKPKFNSAKFIYPPYNKFMNKMVYKFFIR